MLWPWFVLAISDTPLYGWNFANAPFDTIGVFQSAHVAGGATRGLYGVDVTDSPSLIDLPTLTFGGDLTFELLFKGTNGKMFVCEQSASENGVLIEVLSDQVRVTIQGIVYHLWNSGLEGWVHVVIAVGDDSMVLYVNGALKNSTSVGWYAIPTVSRSICHLGDTFQGEIRAFNVYDEVLSQSDVTAAYDKAIPFNATKLFRWDFKTLSYPEYANPNFAGCPHDSAWTFKHSTSAICSPESTESHSDYSCLHPPYPRDFNDLPLPLSTEEPDTFRCVMKCGGDATCPSKGASECMSVPSVLPPFQVSICMHPGTQGVYYATETTLRSTQLPSPVVTVDGTYDQRGITGNGNPLPGHPLTGTMSFELQVYVDTFLALSDPLSGLLACGSSFQLTFDTSGTLVWTVGGKTVSGGRLHEAKNHIVVTVEANGTTIIYLNNNKVATGHGNPLPGGSSECSMGKGITATFSSLSIYDGVMEEDEVHEAFHHCADEPSPPTPAAPAGESDGTSALTVVAFIAAGITLTASTVGMFALCVVSLI